MLLVCIVIVGDYVTSWNHKVDMLPAGITRCYKLLMLACLAQLIQRQPGNSRHSRKLFLCVKKRNKTFLVFRTVLRVLAPF